MQGTKDGLGTPLCCQQACSAEVCYLGTRLCLSVSPKKSVCCLHLHAVSQSAQVTPHLAACPLGCEGNQGAEVGVCVSVSPQWLFLALWERGGM